MRCHNSSKGPRKPIIKSFADRREPKLTVERAAIGRRITEVELDLLLLMDGKL